MMSRLERTGYCVRMTMKLDGSGYPDTPEATIVGVGDGTVKAGIAVENRSCIGGEVGRSS